MLRCATIKPGILVALSTQINGNVSYKIADITPEHLTEAGAKEAVWKTTRTIADPLEFEAAKKCRSKCRTLITAVCANTNNRFGLMCALADQDKLEAAVAEAQQIAHNFNQSARLSHIDINVMYGMVAADSEQAIQSIKNVILECVDKMEEGVRKSDVELIREAANNTKRSFWYGENSILSLEAEAQVSAAIEAARHAARRIAKAGDPAEITRHTLRTLQESRTRFSAHAAPASAAPAAAIANLA